MSGIIKRILYGATLVALSYPPINADDTFKGMRGPTRLQSDTRVTTTKNNRGVKATTLSGILKYWDGNFRENGFGKWVFLSVPYRHIENLVYSAHGIGNVTAGIGVRGTYNNFHFLGPTLSVTFPTTETRPAVGNRRFDVLLNTFLTVTPPSRSYDLDVSLEYKATGEDRSGSNPPNEYALGFVMGKEIIKKKSRIAAGLTSVVNDDGGYALNTRGVARHTFSPRFHMETIVDRGIKSKNLAKAKGITLLGRCNF